MTKIILSLILSFVFTSCATLRSTNMYNIPVFSDPEGSTIKITDKKGKVIFIGQCPDTLILKSGHGYFKKAEYLIEASHVGYISQKIPIYFILDGKYYQNFFLSFAMPIGFFIVDPISGAMWKPEKNKINILLKKESIK